MYIKEINKLINKVKNDKKLLKCGNYKYNYSFGLVEKTRRAIFIIVTKVK